MDEDPGLSDAATVNALLEEARADAERFLPELEGVYAAALERIARSVGRNFDAMTAASWTPPPEGNLAKDVEAVATTVVARLRREYESILRVAIGRPLARLGVRWDPRETPSVSIVDGLGRRTGKRLGEAVQPIVREVVADAYDRDLSVPDTAALLRERLVDAAPWQSEMLARTDLNALSNLGSVRVAKLVGVAYKTWEATLDDRTRPEHSAAHGQTVPVDGAFDVGGERLDAPGDPAGSDAMVANCRCTLTYADGPDGLTAGGGVMKTTQTGEALAVTITVDEEDAAVDAPARWRGPITFERLATSDGRWFESWSWRDLPIDLLAQLRTAAGHDGAEVVGKIEKVWKEPREDLGEGVVAVMGEGTFASRELSGEVAALVDDKTLRRISVDYSAGAIAFRDPKTGEIISREDVDLERVFSGELQIAALEAEIGAATLVSFSAFGDAMIAMVASSGVVLGPRLEVGDAPAALTAGSGARRRKGLAAPTHPPREWLETQEPPGKMPLTVTREGRLFGHLATWDACHTSFAVCTTPPKSLSGYAYFHTAELEAEDGTVFAVGKLMLGGKHAPLSKTRAEAMSHYDDRSHVAGYLRARDGVYGIWVAGAVHPRLSDDDLRELRTLPPSGDWRPVSGQLELIAALAVPIPGFPVPRAEVAMIASGDDLVVSALVASSGPFAPDAAALRALTRAGLVSDEDARIARLVARAEGGIEGLAALAEG